jgi:hypothetical protein
MISSRCKIAALPSAAADKNSDLPGGQLPECFRAVPSRSGRTPDEGELPPKNIAGGHRGPPLQPPAMLPLHNIARTDACQVLRSGVSGQDENRKPGTEFSHQAHVRGNRSQKLVINRPSPDLSAKTVA